MLPGLEERSLPGLVPGPDEPSSSPLLDLNESPPSQTSEADTLPLPVPRKLRLLPILSCK